MDFLPLLLKYLLSGLILVTFSSALGLFLSIISNKDDVLALLLGFVLCVLSLWLLGMFIDHIIDYLGKGFAPAFQPLYLFHFSPNVCILDFLNTHYAFQAGNPLISLLTPLLFTLLFLGSAYLIFKRLQNVEGNDFKP